MAGTKQAEETSIFEFEAHCRRKMARVVIFSGLNSDFYSGVGPRPLESAMASGHSLDPQIS